jgi:hypothetical protein
MKCSVPHVLFCVTPKCARLEARGIVCDCVGNVPDSGRSESIRHGEGRSRPGLRVLRETAFNKVKLSSESTQCMSRLILELNQLIVMRTKEGSLQETCTSTSSMPRSPRAGGSAQRGATGARDHVRPNPIRHRGRATSRPRLTLHQLRRATSTASPGHRFDSQSILLGLPLVMSRSSPDALEL